MHMHTRIHPCIRTLTRIHMHMHMHMHMHIRIHMHMHIISDRMHATNAHAYARHTKPPVFFNTPLPPRRQARI